MDLTRILIPIESDSTNMSISAFSVYLEILMRIDESACDEVNPNAKSVSLGPPECEEHADPEDTHIPFPDRKLSIVWLFIPGKVKLMI